MSFVVSMRMRASNHKNLNFKTQHKMVKISPGQCDSDGVSPSKTKRQQVQKAPIWGACERQPIDVSLSHQCLSPSFPTPSL